MYIYKLVILPTEMTLLLSNFVRPFCLLATTSCIDKENWMGWSRELCLVLCIRYYNSYYFL